MEYNSTRDNLKFPEYGRNVQNLVEFLKTIEDVNKKQAYAEAIVDLMYQVDYHERNNFDNRAKLWKHLFMIADYELEGVIPTVGEIPTPENTKEKVLEVEYPQKSPRYRHYGNNIMKLVEKAKSMEDPEKKEAFINVIGSYMKLAYKNWNQEHYVNDEFIIKDLQSISDGDLEVPQELPLDFLKISKSQYSQKTSRTSNGRGRKKSKSNNGRRRPSSHKSGSNRNSRRRR